MKRPKIVLFDYGQTLLTETFNSDPAAGIRAVMAHVTENPNGVTAEEVFAFSRQLREELWDSYRPDCAPLEIHNAQFNRYLLEYFGLSVDLRWDELDTLYWDTVSPGVPTEHIEELLETLRRLGVRSGVISNLNYCGKTLSDRIARALPEHSFEFIMASSEYVFCKPSPRLFTLALKKARLSPEEAWFCGDSAAADVEGAARAGLTAFWYTGAYRGDGAKPRCAYREIRDWTALAALVEQASE